MSFVKTCSVFFVLVLLCFSSFAQRKETREEWLNSNKSDAPQVRLMDWRMPADLSRSHAGIPDDVKAAVIRGEKSSWDYQRDAASANVTKLRSHLLFSPRKNRYYIVSTGKNVYAHHTYFGILEVKEESDVSREKRIKNSTGLGVPQSSLFQIIGSWDYTGPTVIALHVSDTGIASAPEQDGGAAKVAVKSKDCSRLQGLERLACEAEKLGTIGGMLPRR